MLIRLAPIHLQLVYLSRVLASFKPYFACLSKVNAEASLQTRLGLDRRDLSIGAFMMAIFGKPVQVHLWCQHASHVVPCATGRPALRVEAYSSKTTGPL